MALDLTQPLRWKEADRAILENLQGNILKGHGRDHTINLFLRFDRLQQEAARDFVRAMADKVTSAHKQLTQSEIFNESGKKNPGDTFVAFFLSAKGYNALGIEAGQTPKDPSFVRGLKLQGDILNDPEEADWDEQFHGEIHAMVLIAEDNDAKRAEMHKEIVSLMNPAVSVVGTEIGLAMRNPSNDGIEHFGYVDGRSQPLLLVEDIEEETDTTDGIHVWDPTFPVGQALVECPGGETGISYGSYFVFRKLEQDVKNFKDTEKEIAVKVLNLPKKDRELGGAMLVGRFEDGTPVVIHAEDGADNPVPNNFSYESDVKGLKCPYHGHIRKTNPRGETAPRIVPEMSDEEIKAAQEALAFERSHIMARRGITYGERVWENGAVNTVLDEDHLPNKDVGLLFMAYQNDIANQFEFTQRFWANNEGFLQGNTGLDPIIGQFPPNPQPPESKPIELTQTRKWGADEKKNFSFHGFVKMKGGEYFYAPCRSFLRSV